MLGVFRLQDGLKRLQERSKTLSIGSKSHPERSKRPSRGFPRASASKLRSGPRLGPFFGSQTESLGPLKSRNCVRHSSKIKVSSFSARFNFGPRFGTLPGSVLGASGPPRRLKPVLRSVLERPRAAQEHFISMPEASKTAPRSCKMLQDGPKSRPRPAQDT